MLVGQLTERQMVAVGLDGELVLQWYFGNREYVQKIQRQLRIGRNDRRLLMEFETWHLKFYNILWSLVLIILPD